MTQQITPPRAIGLAGAVLLNLNATIGAGIFALPALLYAGVGDIAPLVVLAFALLAAMPMLVIAKLSTMFAQSGGSQLYVERAYGPLPGFLAGWSVMGGNVAARAANFHVLVSYLAAMFPLFDDPVLRMGTILALIASFTTLSVLGTRQSLGVLWLGTVLKVGPILVICLAGLLVNGVPRTLHLPEFTQVESIALLLAYAYSGGNLATVAAGEVKDAQRTVFLSILTNLAVIALFYAFVQWAFIAINPQDVNADRPLASAGEAVLGPWGVAAISMAAIFSTGCNQLAMFISMPRVLFGMGQRGLLPAALARVSPVLLTPATAIIVYGSLVALLAVSGTFATLATFMVALEALLFLAVVLALPVMWLRNEDATNKGNRAKWGTLVMLAACFEVWMLLQAPASAVVPTIGVLLAGTGAYYLARRKKPA
jgi:amino acid transporter